MNDILCIKSDGERLRGLVSVSAQLDEIVVGTRMRS